jgi:hypothetical protein
MPLSYFPPLPETIWGNLSGDIELQTDLIDLINSKAQSIANRNNLIINPNFKIWQKWANQISVTNRRRLSNVATLQTAVPHGYVIGDEVQITSMVDSSYDAPNGATITATDSTHFSYSSSGSDESDVSETAGKALLINRPSLTPANAEMTSDRWLALNDSNNIVLSPEQGSGVKIVSNSSGKFALMQVIPAKHIKQHLGAKFAASVDIKSSGSSVATIALLSWSGTEDSTNSSAISSWNTVGTSPTLSTNWSYEASSGDCNLTSSFQTVKLENVEIGTVGANNVALLILVEASALGETITIDNAQLLVSSELTDFVPNSFERDIAECRRFYTKSYTSNSPIFRVSSSGLIVFATSFGTGDGDSFGNIFFQEMYGTPTVRLIATNNPPEVAKWQVSSGVNIDVSVGNVSEKSFSVVNNSGFTVSTASVSGHYELSVNI